MNKKMWLTCSILLLLMAFFTTASATEADHVHTGGEATCASLAVCDVCGAEYGELNLANHEWDTVWQGMSPYGHARFCKGGDKCNGVVTDMTPHTFVEGSFEHYVSVLDDTLFFQYSFECTVCGSGGGIYPSHLDWVQAAMQTIPATCLTNEIYTFTTDVPVYGVVQPLTWTYEKPDTVNADAHTFAPANCMEGIKCTTCGLIVDETPNPETHLWVSNDDGTHSCQNSACGLTSIPCAGGAATCMDAAVCDTCGTQYGERNPDNHVWNTDRWESDMDGHWYACANPDCGWNVRGMYGEHDTEEGSLEVLARIDYTYNNLVCELKWQCTVCGVNHFGLGFSLDNAEVVQPATCMSDKVIGMEANWFYAGSTHTHFHSCAVANTIDPTNHVWVPNGDGTHSCANEACNIVAEPCVFGDANCMTGSPCKCGATTGELDPNNHVPSNRRTYDLNSSWYPCENPDCAGVRIDERPHTLVNDINHYCSYQAGADAFERIVAFDCADCGWIKIVLDTVSRAEVVSSWQFGHAANCTGNEGWRFTETIEVLGETREYTWYAFIPNTNFGGHLIPDDTPVDYHACLRPECWLYKNCQPCYGNVATCTQRTTCWECQRPFVNFVHQWESNGDDTHSCALCHKMEACTGTITCLPNSICEVCGGEFATNASGDHAWLTNNDGTHSCQNTACGLTNIPCEGGKATCMDAAACNACGAPYGELDPDTHAWDTEYWATNYHDHWRVCLNPECSDAQGMRSMHVVDESSIEFHTWPVSTNSFNCKLNYYCEICGSIDWTRGYSISAATVIHPATCMSEAVIGREEEWPICDEKYVFLHTFPVEDSINPNNHVWAPNGDGTHSCTNDACDAAAEHQTCTGEITCMTTSTCDACGGEFATDGSGDHIWISNDDGTHRCSNPVCDAAEPCVGGTATCMVQAVCTACNAPYGELNMGNHVLENYWANGFSWNENGCLVEHFRRCTNPVCEKMLFDLGPCNAVEGSVSVSARIGTANPNYPYESIVSWTCLDCGNQSHLTRHEYNELSVLRPGTCSSNEVAELNQTWNIGGVDYPLHWEWEVPNSLNPDNHEWVNHGDGTHSCANEACNIVGEPCVFGDANCMTGSPCKCGATTGELDPNNHVPSDRRTYGLNSSWYPCENPACADVHIDEEFHILADEWITTYCNHYGSSDTYVRMVRFYCINCGEVTVELNTVTRAEVLSSWTYANPPRCNQEESWAYSEVLEIAGMAQRYNWTAYIPGTALDGHLIPEDTSAGYHACLRPECWLYMNPQPCRGQDATCTKLSTCWECRRPYGDYAHQWGSNGNGTHSCASCDAEAVCTGTITCLSTAICDACGGEFETDASGDHAWVSNGDGTHSCQNPACGLTDIPCEGGAATCISRAMCADCGGEYGELNPDNHEWNTDWWAASEMTHYRFCKNADICGWFPGLEEPHTFVEGSFYQHAYLNNGIVYFECYFACEVCGKINFGFSTNSPWVMENVHIIEATCIKGETYNLSQNMVILGEPQLVSWSFEMPGTRNPDAHVFAPANCMSGEKCRECGLVVEGSDIDPSMHAWVSTGDGNHVCANPACDAVAPCYGGTATCMDVAVCEGCYEPYGELNMENHVLDKNWWTCWENREAFTAMHYRTCLNPACGGIQLDYGPCKVVDGSIHTYTEYYPEFECPFGFYVAWTCEMCGDQVGSGGCPRDALYVQRPGTCADNEVLGFSAVRNIGGVTYTFDFTWVMPDSRNPDNHVLGEPAFDQDFHWDTCTNPDCADLRLKDEPHKLNYDEAVPPTCTEEGLSNGAACDMCGFVTDEPLMIPALGHDLVYKEIIAPTCTEPGLSDGTACSRCDYVTTEEVVIPALGHELVICDAIAPTCDMPGMTEAIVCIICGHVEIEPIEIAPIGHKLIVNKGIPATCTEAGMTDEVLCINCGLLFEEKKTIPATGHKMELDIAIQPTCTTQGLSTGGFCVLCDYQTTEKAVLPALGHALVYDCIIKDPTCTDEGLCESAACERCDYVITGEVSVPPMGHDYIESFVEATCTESACVICECMLCSQIVIEVLPDFPARGHQMEVIEGIEPTCTEPGMTEGAICVVCGEWVIKQDKLPALGHDLIHDIIEEPTCTKPGLSNCVSCSRCDYLLSEKQELPALGHNLFQDIVTPPTCTEDGLSRGMYCARCDYVVSDQQTVPALGHIVGQIVKPATSTSSGIAKCATCNSYFTLPAVEHNWVIVTPETCGSEGQKRCSLCDKIETIPATGFHEWVVDAEASCISEGRNLCVVCKEMLVIEKLPHTLEILPAVDATCTATGLTEGVKCVVCGMITIEQEETPLGDHVYIIASRPATCTKEGWESKACENCDFFDKTVITALGHTVETLAAVDATCTATGLTAGQKCAVCDEILVQQEVIAVLDHVKTAVKGNAPTCTEDGLSEGSICKLCDEVLVKQEIIPALGHDWTSVKDATCTSTGIQKCAVCSAYAVAEKLSHALEIIPAVEATCTATGLTAGEQCAMCGKITIEQTLIPMAEHKSIVVDAVKPTCTDVGLTEGAQCAVCGAVLTEQEVIPAMGHNWIIGKDATCTTNGTKMCAKCGIVVAIDMLPHTAEALPAVEPTCTAPGLTEGEKCGVCGTVLLEQQAVAALGHAWTQDPEKGVHACTRPNCELSVETACTGGNPTCKTFAQCEVCGLDYLNTENHTLSENWEANADQHWKPCSECGVTLTEDFHTLTSEPRTIVIASGSVIGQYTLRIDFACDTCDNRSVTLPQLYSEADFSVVEAEDKNSKTLTKSLEVSIAGESQTLTWVYLLENATKHVPVLDARVEPTCLVPGKTEGSHCNLCGEVLTEQMPIPALGHNAVEDPAVDPDCTTKGLTAGSHCERCDMILVRQLPVAALGHKLVVDPAVAATCTSTGLTAGRHCERCGETTLAQSTVPMKPHVQLAIAATKPTCTETGLTAGTKCRTCDAVLLEQETVPALGHVEVELPAKDATCTATGLTAGMTCQTCKETLVAQEVIPTTDHTVVVLPAVDPTCLVPGKTEGSSCSVCRKVLVAQEAIPALGHNAVEDPAVDPDCTTKGLTAGSHCERCDTILVRQLPVAALGHKLVVDPAVAATCTSTGLTAGRHCERCGETTLAQSTVPMKAHSIVVDKAVPPTATTTGLTQGTHCRVCNLVLIAQEIIPATGK